MSPLRTLAKFTGKERSMKEVREEGNEMSKNYFKARFKYFPVYDFGLFAICSGVPFPTR